MLRMDGFRMLSLLSSDLAAADGDTMISMEEDRLRLLAEAAAAMAAMEIGSVASDAKGDGPGPNGLWWPPDRVREGRKKKV